MFAKLYENENGQILVKLDTNKDDNPAVEIFFEPEDFGVCKIAIDFEGDDAWEKAEKAFSEVSEEGAAKAVEMTLKEIGLK